LQFFKCLFGDRGAYCNGKHLVGLLASGVLLFKGLEPLFTARVAFLREKTSLYASSIRIEFVMVLVSEAFAGMLDMLWPDTFRFFASGE